MEKMARVRLEEHGLRLALCRVALPVGSHIRPVIVDTLVGSSPVGQLAENTLATMLRCLGGSGFMALGLATG